MTYSESLEWLYTQVPNYQNFGSTAYKPGLQNILALMDFYDSPHKKIKSIHIAGTNGKGSTSHSVASILQEQGYKVGLFTSPHLKNFTERIRINGKECDESFIHKEIINIKNANLDVHPSFFEITTAFAFKYFADNKVDIAVIEVGLGGRLDSTNIITPEVCAITSISYDHQDILGNTLDEISNEKAGIIKDNIPVVIGETSENLINIIKDKANKHNSPVIIPKYSFLETDLKGNCQKQNQKTVLGIIDVLIKKGYTINENSIHNGLKNVIKNTNLRGRWEILETNPTIICDTGHNEAGIKLIVEQLISLNKPVIMILGFVQGKKVETILKLLPKNMFYIFTQPTISRALSPFEYENKIIEYKLNYKIIQSIDGAYLYGRNKINGDEVLFIGGSTFMVADILEKFY